MQSRLSYRRPFASVPLPQFPEISLRFFFFPLPSICCSAVDWPCQSAHYRHLPSPGSAHLISLARPRPLPSFTFLSLLLLILARRDFGLFCGIGANSSSLFPFSFRRRRQLCPPPRSSPEEEGDRLGASVTRRERALPLPRIDGWIGVLVNWRCFRHSSLLPPPLPIVSRCQMSIDDAAVAAGAAAGDPCGPAAGARAGPLPRR